VSDVTTALQRLYARAPKGMSFGLDRVRAAAEKLGNVHRLGTYVHVAGTNGKGSTAAFVATMAQFGGATVGLYTSPHLCRFAERIRIDGKPVDDTLLADCLDEALGVSEELTFFEVATLAALLAFRTAGVNLPVLEVGLGGQLDATNIVEGRAVPVITRVAFDHVDLLGTSLAQIAREKAGILRPEVTTIVGRLHPDARAEVDRIATQLGSTVYEATTEDEARFVDSYPPSLPGPFQRHNAMAAVAAARALGLPPQAIAQGLTGTRWPGRCEVIETAEGYVLLDCAHNPDGALALKNALLGYVMSFPRRHVALVFGAMADKNWKAMIDRLAPVTGPRVYVEPRGGRASAPAAEMVAHLDGEVALGVGEALEKARQRVGRGGLVVVAGSTFLVGATRGYLLGMRMDPQVALLGLRGLGWGRCPLWFGGGFAPCTPSGALPLHPGGGFAPCAPSRATHPAPRQRTQGLRPLVLCTLLTRFVTMQDDVSGHTLHGGPVCTQVSSCVRARRCTPVHNG
jgi:dihydrofolate synthase / folylpolyglutamate synthase